MRAHRERGRLRTPIAYYIRRQHTRRIHTRTSSVGEGLPRLGTRKTSFVEYPTGTAQPPSNSFNPLRKKSIILCCQVYLLPYHKLNYITGAERVCTRKDAQPREGGMRNEEMTSFARLWHLRRCNTRNNSSLTSKDCATEFNLRKRERESFRGLYYQLIAPFSIRFFFVPKNSWR